jgi:hypothetical protein
MSDEQGLFNHLYVPKNRGKTPKKKVRKPFFYQKFKQEDREKFSEKLTSNLTTVVDIDSNYKDIPIKEHIFKLTTREDLNQNIKKNIESLDIQWLNALNNRDVVVALPNEKTEQLKTKIEKYGKSGDLHSYLDTIKDISPITPAAKVSSTIENLSENEKEKIEIDFYSGLSLEDYERSIDFIKKIVGESNVRYTKTDPEMPYLRVISTKDKVKKVASSLPSVRKITKVPKVTVVSGEAKKIENVEFGPAPDDLKTVMVIDCGVTHDHPGIRNVLIFRKNYIRGSNTDDSNPISEGHGTSVAGLAVYGMMSNKYPKSITPTSKIGVAKILDDQEDDKPVQEFLDDIVKDGISKGIRIYSLTVMNETEVGEISKLAYVLDTLARERDVLFIISTGNIQGEKLEEFYRIGLPYPRYFINNPQARIYEGAEACCAITVGGIAHLDNPRSIARQFQASPFTRAGPTPDGRLKPDLVYYAGNLETNFESTEDLSLLSLNYKPSTGLYSVNNTGTSFSTPIVANMASQILRTYQNATANLIRALLIHSSDIKDEFRNVAEPRFIYGFGFPNVTTMIKSTRFSPTLIFEGEINGDQFAEVSIPMPKEIKESKGSKFIKITLAYDPKVTYSNANLDYPLIDLSFSILRKNKRGNYKRISGTDKGWKLNEYRRIENNTVKKGVYQWERGHAGEDWVIRIESSVKISKKTITKQRFAIVVTIEDSRKETDLYTPIKQIFDTEQLEVKEASLNVVKPQGHKRN